ncbi:hypothetical protein DFH29DRAFT_1002073 [Suillus ampliporus]|nr:hypothetical protein DFH29DRAFT_1002073 [Suillus ampliporus]
MKDAADTSNYVGQHAVLRECLLHMGVTCSDEEAVFQLLCGLPRLGTWPQFKALIMVTSSPSSLVLTFNKCVAQISAEAVHIIDEHSLNSKPGSEYANAVTTPAQSSSNNVNLITGLHKHCHNPEGVFYTTVGCCKGDHDHAHCYVKGGGIEGQAPWQKHKKKETAAAAVAAPAPAPVPPSASDMIAAFAGTGAAPETFFA